MTIDVESLKSRFESVTDLLDDYCSLVCRDDQTAMSCFQCPVRRAMLEAQSGGLYLTTIQGLYNSLEQRIKEEVRNDFKSDSSRG